MVTEQEKTAEVLKMAIQMETDGKEFYLKASKKSSNDMGNTLLQTLAKEEDLHRIKFQEIYDAISKEMAWPTVDLHLDGGKNLETVLATATREISSDNKGVSTELEAVQTGMAMENKTYDLYFARGEKASGSAEKDFYKSLSVEERIHYQLLQDYYEYLKDPAGWFIRKEHPSLDGG
jgi:rubrerythrin